MREREGGGARGPSRVIDALHSPKLVSTFTSHDGPNCHYLGGNGLRDRVKVISLVPLVSYASRHMGQWCVILNHAPHLLGGVGVYSLDGSHWYGQLFRFLLSTARVEFHFVTSNRGLRLPILVGAVR